MTLEETIIRYAGATSVAQCDAIYVVVAVEMGMLDYQHGTVVVTEDGYGHCSNMGRLLLALHDYCGGDAVVMEG